MLSDQVQFAELRSCNPVRIGYMIVEPETTDDNLQALVLADESGPDIKFVHHSIYTDLPATNAFDRRRFATATDAHLQRSYALDHVQSQAWKS